VQGAAKDTIEDGSGEREAKTVASCRLKQEREEGRGKREEGRGKMEDGRRKKSAIKREMCIIYSNI
jgi:hypothetical protein